MKEDYELRSAIERNLQLAIESALDVGEVIISARGFEKPEDYRSVILILGRHNVIPRDFAERFAEAAKFRNILVHMYAEVDGEMLYGILQNNRGDFDEFAKYIARYLK
ncbi:MAG: type VII toxin-antitoxin system HepT family RNase toxin [Candidatus Cloacimonadia bacterium]